MGLRSGLIRWLGVVLALAFSTAQAQVPARLELGGQVSGAASSPGGDLYVVFGVEGMRLQAQLTILGHGAVTLYDPEGAELSRVEGEGGAELKYTLADDGIYLLGVTRAAAGEDYVLALDGQVPRIEYVYDDPAATPVAAEPTPSVAEPAPVPEPPATPAFVPDPAVWGVYAQLAGRRTVPVPGIYSLAWQWVRPGEALVEQWVDGNDRVVHTSTFTPAGPGKLHKKDDFLVGKGWDGTVESDGSITFVGQGIFMRPHQVGIADGVFEMRMVKKPGRPEMTVEPAGKRTRWVLEAAGEDTP
jgi:hypothetical protein